MVITSLASPLYQRFCKDHRWTLVMYPKSQAAFMSRWERAWTIWPRLYGGGDGVWEATSSQSNTIKYDVSAATGCSCPDANSGGRAPYGWCKHRLAAWIADAVCMDAADAGWERAVPHLNGNAPEVKF